MARRASAAQLRARAKFVRMVRSGAFKRRRNPKRKRSIWDAGQHRPRLYLKRGKRLETLMKQSPYRSETGAPLISKINPRRRRRRNQGAAAMFPNRRRRRSHRRNPVFFNARRRRHSRRNPVTFLNRSRRHRMRRNPAFNVRALLNQQFIMNAFLAAGGFAIGVKSSDMVGKIPGVGMLGKFKGIAHILLGSLAAMYFKQPQVRSLAGGFAAAGAFDLLTSNFPQMFKLPTVAGIDFIGNEGIDGDWDEGQQNGVDFQGIDTQDGDDNGAALVGAAGASYNTQY